MSVILNFIYSNVQWIFSGVGNFLFTLFGKKKKKTASTVYNTSIKGDSTKTIKKVGSIIDNRSNTNNINNGLSGPQVIEIFKTISDKQLQQCLEIARQETANSINLFKVEFFKTIESRLIPEEYNAFKKPDILYILSESISISARKDTPNWREILCNLIVERVKNDSIDSASIIYNEAINSISHLTSDQIKLLSIIDITSSLIFSIINNDILFTEFDLLESFLNEPYVLTNTDIDQLKYCRLISSTFPNEIDRFALITCNKSGLIKTIEKCNELTESFTLFGLNQYQLTTIGYAVSHTYLSIILKSDVKHLSKAPLQLADLEVRRMYAKEGAFDGEVTAFTKKNN